jgi:hypothetical protein
MHTTICANQRGAPVESLRARIDIHGAIVLRLDHG